MKFNIIATNPPYNRGADIDFINLAFEICMDYVVAITPAKWQTADANQMIVSNMTYGQFRDKIVKHMSHVCFYPDCLDVFGIAESSGISWYLIDKNNEYIDGCTVENKCVLQPIINSVAIRDITKQQSLWNIGHEIQSYIYSKYKYKQMYIKQVSVCKRYCVLMNTQGLKQLGQSGAYDWTNMRIDLNFVGKGGVAFNKEGKAQVIGGVYLVEKGDEPRPIEEAKEKIVIFTSNNKLECESYISYIKSKLVKFLVFINLSSMRTANNNSFRLVPSLDEFNHIYTNDEIYKRFNLPKRYQEIIEDIIKD